MAEIKKGPEHSRIENVGEALTKAEFFIEKNQKIITYVVIAILVVIGAILLIKKEYLEPLNEQAHDQMYVAEQYFQKDSFYLALNGDGNNFGMIKIIDEFGLTSAANLAHYYAGICYYKLGKYQDAIEQLEKFKANDKLVAPLALGTIGDAYSEIGNNEKAIKYYLKAAKKSENELTSPVYLMKAGGICEDIGDFNKALDIYKIIQDKYPISMEGREIDKYMTRLQIKIGKKQ